MPYHRINRASETLTLLMVALWGNWALYYWVMVIGLDASYWDLKAGLPVLLAQIGATMLIMLRQDLGFADPLGKSALPLASRTKHEHRGLLIPILLSLGFAGIALAAWALGWSRSPLGYNLLWGLMTPLALTLYLRPRPGDSHVGQDEPPDRNSAHQIIDLVGLVTAFFIALTVVTIKGFPTPDDAFYAHVMSSTLANPGLPVQGQDLLFGTSAPYSLHPGYRVSGYEVLAALISDLTDTDPLWVYYELYPLLGTLLWVLVAHLFLRSLGVPYPGVGVLVALLVLLHWHARKSLGIWFGFIYMGKGQVSAILAPLLFAATASFCRRPTGNTWLLLLLSVCGVGAWSSSTLFIVPVALAIATAVYLPIGRRSLPGLTLIGLTSIPILLLLGVTLQVAAQVPPYTGARQTGQILVAGQALGGAWAKALLFVTLLALPVVATATGHSALHSRLVRFGLAGTLSVYAPYWIELLAEQSGMYLLSWRMQWAFPSALIAGILGALVANRLTEILRAKGIVALRDGAVLLLALAVWTAAFLGTSDRPVALGSWQTRIAQWREAAQNGLAEARAVRALIPDEAYVAAGHLHEFLPMLPNPPVFVSVRHYLAYHQNVMEPSEFSQRSFIQRMTDKLAPSAEKNPESVARSVVRKAQRHGVSTLVYRTAPEPRREPEQSVRAEFIGLLTQQLEGAGYRCETTPSGLTRVCNLMSPRERP